FQHLEDAAVRHFMNFVSQDEMRARTGARLPSVSRHWTKEATSSMVGHVVLTAYTTRELNVSRQFRRLANHLHGVREQDRRLVTLGSSRIDLRACLAIGS